MRFSVTTAFAGKRGARVAAFLYRLSLRTSRRVFFQNPDDMQEFASRGLIRNGQGLVVNGSGVDLAHYSLAPCPVNPHFLMICRLLADKGPGEYVTAARSLKKRYDSTRFQLVGALDPNPASVSKKELDQWIRTGAIDYRGELRDVRPAYRECSVYVLPSYYREGTPRTVLEAMAMGRPIITTDAPGCRETVPLTATGVLQQQRGEPVMEGENGFLVRVRDAAALSQAMSVFIEKPELIPVMGRRSREIAEKKYDVHQVNRVILNAMGL